MAPEWFRLSRTVRMLELNLDQEIAGHAVVDGTRVCPGDAPLRGLTLHFRAARSDLPSDLARTEAVYGVPGCRPRLGPAQQSPVSGGSPRPRDLPTAFMLRGVAVARSFAVGRPGAVENRSIFRQSRCVRWCLLLRAVGKLGSHDGSGRRRGTRCPLWVVVGCGAVVRWARRDYVEQVAQATQALGLRCFRPEMRHVHALAPHLRQRGQPPGAQSFSCRRTSDVPPGGVNRGPDGA
jgi:hypothetical protein